MVDVLGAKKKTFLYNEKLHIGQELSFPVPAPDLWLSYLYLNHNYNKIVRSDWLSTALISALIGQFSRTVRVMPK